MATTLYTQIFWASLGVLSYTYLGYPVLIYALGRLSRPPRATDPSADLPAVTVVLCVHNEQDRVQARLQNLLDSAYPADKLDIVVVSDGSTDATVARANALKNCRVAVRVESVRRGKAQALNAGVAAARGEVIVFADARQTFPPATIPK